MQSTLPADEAEILRALRQDSLPELRLRALALHKAGWPLRAIGEPLGVPRSTVHLWVNTAGKQSAHSSLSDLPPPPRHTMAPTNRLRFNFLVAPRAVSADVPFYDKEKLADLAVTARKNRGGSSPGSIYRQARNDLNSLVLHYSEKGVPTSRLAELTGVTYRAMIVRLAEAREEAAR